MTTALSAVASPIGRMSRSSGVSASSTTELVRRTSWCQASTVRSYGQYCPIARASEVLAERWSIIILRNIVILGCRTFNEIAACAPGMSRGLLSKRLRDLERAGVLEIRRKPDGPGSIYEPTQAGRELSEVMMALQHWGSKWADLTPNRPTPAWCCGCGRRSTSTVIGSHRGRTLVRFDYPTLSGAGSRGWLLIERGDAEICETYPGGEEDLVVVVHDPLAFARWHLGEIRWGDALRSGAIELQGSLALARGLPTWHRDSEDGLQPLHAAAPPEHAPLEFPPAEASEVQTLHFSSHRPRITLAAC